MAPAGNRRTASYRQLSSALPVGAPPTNGPQKYKRRYTDAEKLQREVGQVVNAQRDETGDDAGLTRYALRIGLVDPER